MLVRDSVRENLASSQATFPDANECLFELDLHDYLLGIAGFRDCLVVESRICLSAL